MKKIDFGSKPFVIPTPTLVIAAFDSSRKANMMTACWGGVISHGPKAYIGVSVQPVRHTYHMIKERKAFSINVPSVKHLKETDYAGIYSGSGEDKFEYSGLTAVPGEKVDAPIIKEFPVNMECILFDSIDINKHTQFIGEVQNVKVDENCLNEEGVPILSEIAPIIYSTPEGKYYSTGKEIGKSYQVGKKK